MNSIPGTLDTILFLVVTLVSPVLEWKWLYPRLKRAAAAGVPGARMRFYWTGVASERGFVACVIALWVARARPWSALWIGPLTGWRLAVALALAGGGTALVWLQQRSIFTNPKLFQVARDRFAGAEDLFPHAPGDRAGFAMVSITAGICEEVLYRGFVAWYLAAWLGPVPAYAISALLFGVAHIYLTRDHAIRAAIAGVFATCIVIVTGSLLPAIVLHAVTDLSAGVISYRLATGEKPSS